jgi:hypothetical protein
MADGSLRCRGPNEQVKVVAVVGMADEVEVERSAHRGASPSRLRLGSSEAFAVVPEDGPCEGIKAFEKRVEALCRWAIAEDKGRDPATSTGVSSAL